jgi:hypothetical protein
MHGQELAFCVHGEATVKVLISCVRKGLLDDQASIVNKNVQAPLDSLLYGQIAA